MTSSMTESSIDNVADIAMVGGGPAAVALLSSLVAWVDNNNKGQSSMTLSVHIYEKHDRAWTGTPYDANLLDCHLVNLPPALMNPFDPAMPKRWIDTWSFAAWYKHDMPVSVSIHSVVSNETSAFITFGIVYRHYSFHHVHCLVDI
jgi:uncharacterized NAD(P)/FAD-binding protein YdhS